VGTGSTSGRRRAFVRAQSTKEFLCVLPVEILYGVSARDPITVTMSFAVLLSAGALAGLLPGWRALRVDPGDRVACRLGTGYGIRGSDFGCRYVPRPRTRYPRLNPK
jgi:hypothetical protein